MRWIWCAFLVLFFVSSVHGSDCHCSGRGFCKGNSTKCNCVGGFFGSNCSVTINTIRPDLWVLYQVVLGGINVFWIFGFGIGFLLAPRMDYTTNVTKLTLGIFAILGFIAGLHYCIDPYGLKFYNVNYIFICIIEGIRYPTALFIFMVIAFHWLELYIETIERLDQQEMIQRIKQNYNKEVTIEDILGTVQNIKRLRIPCIVIMVFFVIFRLVGTIMKGLLLPSFVQMNIAFISIFLAAFLLFSFISLFYGKKLYKLYPRPIDARMKRITYHVVGLGIYQTILQLVGFIQSQTAKYDETNVTSWFAADFVFNVFLTTAGAWVFIVFAVPVYQAYYYTLRGERHTSRKTDTISEL